MKNQEYYENILINKSNLLEELNRLLKASKHFSEVNVNFEIETINAIEEWYIAVLSSNEQVDISLTKLEDIMIIYYGEACIFQVGGEWAFPKRKTDISYQTPVITRSGDLKLGSIDISTVGMIRAIQRKKQKGQMFDSLNYFINKEQINKDLMKQMENLDGRKKK